MEMLFKCATEVARLYRVSRQSCTLYTKSAVSESSNALARLNYGIIAKTKVVIGAAARGAQHRGLWCKLITTACRGYDTVSYNKRAHLIVYFPVLQKQNQCVPQRRTWAASTKTKKRREGERCSIHMPMFNQSHMAQSEEPGKGHGFRKSMASFWQR